MQNIYYFIPLTFIPQPLGSSQPFLHPMGHSPFIVDQNRATLSESENSNKNLLQTNKGEPIERYSEEVRSSPQGKTIGKSQKNVRNQNGKQQDDEYRLEIRQSNGIVYKKKNTQSNIINQIFSFICTNKSKKIVLQFFNKDEQKAIIFYTIMQKIKRSNKKYVNRKFISSLIDPQTCLLMQRTMGKLKENLVKIDEVRKLLRVLIHRFLREDVNSILLTSLRISKDTLPQHFWRKRQITAYFFGNQTQSSFQP